jgi:branched-chain amino acid transport system permease protein
VALTLTAMVLIGGAAKALGPVLGAAVILAIPELVRALGGGSTEVGAFNYLVMGAALILFAVFRPRGILGGYEFR